MGTTFKTKTTLREERRPPENPDAPGEPYDSVFAEAGVANRGRQEHNEYVCFDRKRVYPEHIVWYKL